MPERCFQGRVRVVGLLLLLLGTGGHGFGMGPASSGGYAVLNDRGHTSVRDTSINERIKLNTRKGCWRTGMAFPDLIWFGIRVNFPTKARYIFLMTVLKLGEFYFIYYIITLKVVAYVKWVNGWNGYKGDLGLNKK